MLKKAEIQITNESFVPVSYYTSETPAATKMEVKIKTVSSNADHPGDAQLRNYEALTMTLTTRDPLPPTPPPVQPAKP